MDPGGDGAFPDPPLAEYEDRAIALGNGGNRQMNPFLNRDKGFQLPFPVLCDVTAYHEVIRYPPTYSNAGSKPGHGQGRCIPQGVSSVWAYPGKRKLVHWIKRFSLRVP